MKAFSYLRVSGKGQVDGDGFPRQRETIGLYATARSIEIVREFSEKGVAGTKDSFDRPELSDLMAAIASNGVRLVLVERSDRLARDLMIGEVILAEFRKLGARVVACDSDTDLTVEDGDPTRTLIRQVLGAIAQWEKSVIVCKLRSARMRKKLANGRCEGRKPFGFFPQEQAVITKMEILFAGGENYASIARTLNAEGMVTRIAGSRWHTKTVAAILRRNAK